MAVAEPKPVDFAFPVAKSIGFLMHGTAREMRALLRNRLRAEGIDLSVWFYLRVLWEEDGITQKELTKRVGDVQPSSVAALRSLEAMEFVTLERDAGDKRKIRITLTRQGRAIKRRLLRIAAEVNDGIDLAGFTAAETQHLRDYLQRIRKNIAAANAKGAL